MTTKPNEREIRVYAQGLELRAEDDDENQVIVEGYAALFDVETDLYWFREKIAKGAFTRAIKEDDVRLLLNHDDLPLARNKSGNLELKEDDKGLFIRATLDRSDPDVQRIVPKMKRGDLNQMSFAFRAEKSEWDETEEPTLRTVLEAELFDVSIVTYPAYEDTDVALRSLNKHKEKVNSSRGKTVSIMKMKQRMAQA